jgi:hypothetical protein
MDNRIIIVGLLFVLLIVICFLLVTIELFEGSGKAVGLIPIPTRFERPNTLLSGQVGIEEANPQSLSKHIVDGYDGMTYYRDMEDFIEKRSSQLVPI